MSTRFHATASFSWWSQFSWPKWSWLREAAGEKPSIPGFKLHPKAAVHQHPCPLTKPERQGWAPASPLSDFNSTSAGLHCKVLPQHTHRRKAFPSTARIRESWVLVAILAPPSSPAQPTSWSSPKLNEHTVSSLQKAGPSTFTLKCHHLRAVAFLLSLDYTTTTSPRSIQVFCQLVYVLSFGFNILKHRLLFEEETKKDL